MLTGVVEGRLISVVAVGDDELFILKSGGKQVESIGVVDTPDAVQDLVLVGHFHVRRGRRVEQQALGAEAGVGVQHEDLAKVSTGGAQQVKPIALWFGERLFVTENDLLGVIVKAAESDEASALQKRIGRAGNSKALRVGEDAGLAFLGKDAAFTPG